MELPAPTRHDGFEDLHSLVDTENELDIRWQLVCDYIANDIAPDTHEDKYIWAAYKYRIAAQKVHSLRDRCKLCKDHAVVARAIDYYRDSRRQAPFMEALTLCNDISLTQQADYMGVDEEVIIMYEKLFFDIRHRKAQVGYVVSKVLHPDLAHNFDDVSSPMFSWKVIAVHGGFRILESCFTYGQINEDAIDFHKAAGLSALALKFGLGNQFRPVNAYTVTDITDQLTRIEEIRHKHTLAEQEQRSSSHGAGGEADLIGSMFEMVTPEIKAMDAPHIKKEPRVQVRLQSEDIK